MKSNNSLTQFEIDDIINRCSVCHIAMIDLSGLPYVLPFNFCYHNGSLYIHGSQTGKKTEIWKTNPNICVAFSSDYELHAQNPNVACSHSMRYRSVLIHGTIARLDDIDEKRCILNIVMKKYTQREGFEYATPSLQNVAVYKITPSLMEGKTYGY